LVVRSGEQFAGENGEAFDLACDRPFVGPAQAGVVGGVDHDRLSAHREVMVA
jgi:hypothetical protein